LKQYILKGYAINERRLEALQKTVEIQTKMIAGTLDIEQQDVLKAVNLYTQALGAITLMIAESNPDEKDIMTAMVMNLLRI